MLAHDWDASWAVLEPALNYVRSAVLERFPDISGFVERSAYGQVYFSARVYFMNDPVHDEHELVLLEIEVASAVSDVSTPPALVFDATDPAVVSMEVWSPSPEGRTITRKARSIPPGATTDEIDRITSAFFSEVVADLPSATLAVVSAIQAALDGNGGIADQ